MGRNCEKSWNRKGIVIRVKVYRMRIAGQREVPRRRPANRTLLFYRHHFYTLLRRLQRRVIRAATTLHGDRTCGKRGRSSTRKKVCSASSSFEHEGGRYQCNFDGDKNTYPCPRPPSGFDQLFCATTLINACQNTFSPRAGVSLRRIVNVCHDHSPNPLG